MRSLHNRLRWVALVASFALAAGCGDSSDDTGSSAGSGGTGVPGGSGGGGTGGIGPDHGYFYILRIGGDIDRVGNHLPSGERALAP